MAALAGLLTILAAGCAETGTDVVTCDPGLLSCAGACVDPQTDHENCGRCGRACTASQACVGGACVLDCGPSMANCGDACRDLQNDPANCGLCNNRCTTDQACVGGLCVLDCGSGSTDCGGSCHDLTTDEEHCGTCHHACDAGTVCDEGACVVSCGPGLTECGGTCRDLTTDEANCGTCGNACDPAERCDAGSCSVACSAGLTVCGDVCRDLMTDHDHCGACDHACAVAEACAVGTCFPTCETGLSWCVDACVDPLTDEAHCGGCGRACEAGETCVAGVCSAVRPASCREALELGLSTGDGAYTLDPDAAGPLAPQTFWCDMTTDGGGWTLTYKIRSDIDQGSNPWWNQVMPGSGSAFPANLDVPVGHFEGPTLADRASLTARTGAVEWRAQTRRGGAAVFDVATSSTAAGGQALRCFAAGTCSSATQTCSSSLTDGRVLLNTLGGPIAAGGTGYVCDVGWTDCDFCVDWSEIRTDASAGGDTSRAIRYVGDTAIALADATTYYFVR
jgi:hypothetical protein